MKGVTTYSILSTLIKSLWIISMGALLVSCADDTIYTERDKERNIRFAISEEAWNSGSVHTRANEAPNVITLLGGERTLYLVPSVRDGISLNSHNTRGSQITSSDIKSFGVFASISGKDSYPDYMYNEEVTSENGWLPTHEYLWPGDGSLHINTYSPFVYTPLEEGITSLPSKTDRGDLLLTYKVPESVGDQVDFMWGTPRDASASPCEIAFNHALCAIRFSTGTEMAPCTIKEITIKGVKNTGKLNLENGEWSALEGNVSYNIATDVVLNAAEGEKYVAAGTAITEGINTMLLMPQELDSSSSIELTVEVDGVTRVLEASLDGQVWTPGQTVTYRISANPNPESLIFDVTGNFATKYTGGIDQYTVKSNYSNGSQTVPVKWIAEFIDNSGNVIERPEWIYSFLTSGIGDTECTAKTVMQDVIFNNMSSQTQTLQNTADINVSSGNTPYNLSSSRGSSNVENTANCYIINAPGKYSIPLVYGNAIKNGVANTSAYTTTSHSKYVLKDFVNHLGKGISDPYIYNNSGCVPADAILIWEDELNIVQNVALSQDGKSIEFDIPHNTIRQGNAMVAVRDTKGQVMWSWHLWITNYKPSDSLTSVTNSGTTYHIYQRTIGEVIGGDVTTFSPRSVLVRFRQIDVPDGLEPLQKVVEITQTGITITTPDCYTFYQWGRKNAIVSDVKQWYDASHEEIKSLRVRNVSEIPNGEIIESYWIQTPDVFWTGNHSFKFAYTNLWNMNLSETHPIKTVYDPSPVGSMVPLATFFHNEFASGATVTAKGTASDIHYITLNIKFAGGSELSFLAMGYRSAALGTTQGQNLKSETWTCDALGGTAGLVESRALILSVNNNGSALGNIAQEARCQGFGIRPMIEL